MIYEDMDDSFYLLGVLLAILTGVVNNFGTVLQKKVVNDLREDSKFMRSLIKKPLWLLGLVMGLGLGTSFFLTAQIFIGPALIPGLMASGLIVLVLGSIKIVGEKLKREEIIGIILMILAIFLLGISELSINIAETNLLEAGFLIRTIIFTILLTIFAAFCGIFQKKKEKYKGILLAIFSGFMFALSNFWISPLMGVISHIFGGIYNLGELILFISSSIILVLTNMIGIMTIQQSFRVDQASNMIPIQQVPIQTTPIIVYFLVFLLAAPNVFSIFYLIVGVILIIFSSFLLGRKQAQLEEIK